jgi:FKBP-type peptidyl-prolyl cis-trans isomerase
MSKGEISYLYIKPEYGYGAHGAGGVNYFLKKFR